MANSRSAFLATVAAAALATPAAYAQQVDEITVTAQKKEQSLQDVPFSVSATTGERLEELRVYDALDLQNVTPALQTPSTGSPGQGASFRLRGFGSPPFQLGIEPAVATYVDGVYRSRSGVSVNDLVDIDRIEVLKGPQGTLFGKNTTAGVVHILTKKPVLGEVEGFGELSYESYERVRGRGAVNAPIGDTMAVRLSGGFGQGEGWLQNVGPVQDQHNLDRYNLRGQFLFEPSDRFDLRLIAEFTSIDEACCTTIRLADGPFTPVLALFAQPFGATVTPPDPEKLYTSINEDMRNDAEEWGLSGEMNFDLTDSLTITSITSYYHYDLETITDGDFVGADILIIDSDVGLQTFTQEIRLAGEMGGADLPINWMLGAYFTDEEIDRLRIFDWQSQVGFYFPPFLSPMPGLGVVDHLGQDSNSYAFFANVEVPLSDRLLFTGGFRYNIERKEGFGNFAQPNNIVLTFVNPRFDAEVREEEPTWSTSLQYDLTDSIMTYFNYARGYKAGGINLAREASGAFGGPSDAVFAPEKVDHFEIGAKSQLFNNRMRLNVALFRDDYDDLQNQIFLPPLFLVRNGEGALIQGFEIEGEIALADGYDILFGVVGLDTEFDDGTDLGSGDVGGEELGWAPKLSASVGWSFRQPVGSMNLFTNGSLLLRGSYRANTDPSPDPLRTQGATQILNARAGVSTENERYELSVWCRNCFDERYSEVVFGEPVDFFPGLGQATAAYVGRPRELGVSIRANF